MRTPAEKIALLKDTSIKKRFRIIKRENKHSPSAQYGTIYRTYRTKDAPYPIHDTIIVFSQKLRDPTNKDKVIEDCIAWGRNHGETHLAPAVKPLIEEFFERKAKRDAAKQKRYDDFMNSQT
ncbi:MAG: hypothetical protein ACMXYK_01275 [Candidatus Woesearchaeota archaeon]